MSDVAPFHINNSTKDIDNNISQDQDSMKVNVISKEAIMGKNSLFDDEKISNSSSESSNISKIDYFNESDSCRTVIRYVDIMTKPLVSDDLTKKKHKNGLKSIRVKSKNESKKLNKKENHHQHQQEEEQLKGKIKIEFSINNTLTQHNQHQQQDKNKEDKIYKNTYSNSNNANKNENTSCCAIF